MTEITTRTRWAYWRWILRLSDYFDGLHANQLSYEQVAEYITSLAGQYAQSSINQAVIAINKYYQCKGIDYRFATKSLRSKQRLPQAVLSRSEAKRIRDGLPEFYQCIFDEVYCKLIRPSTAVKMFKSRGYSERPVHPMTFGKHIKTAGEMAGIVKPVTATVIYQSAIIHYLQDTNNLRGAAQKTGLSDGRILYYYDIARQNTTKPEVKSPLDIILGVDRQSIM